MSSVETTAKTREEAIQAALKKLRAERHEVEVEILDEGAKGIFGIGARDVKVRVTVEGRKSAPDSRRPRGRGRRPKSPAKRSAPANTPRPAPVDKAPPAPTDTRCADAESSRAKKSEPPDARGPEAAALLKTVIECMGIEADVACECLEDGGPLLQITSPDSAIIIGRRGQNLSALQYLINRMVQGQEEGETRERIIVDCEGYTERRRASLEDMAQRMAQKVIDTGRRVRLKPLAAHERRIIHVTLQDDAAVRTFSVGNFEERTVIIAPKDEPASEGRRSRSRRDRSPHRGGRTREQASQSRTPAEGG